ncbi:MAG: hypothetical protein RSE12_16960 [Fuscovulum sp.]|nr:MAG: hypothetical protein RSE12_16960 [Fuscovulum sp.]
MLTQRQQRELYDKLVERFGRTIGDAFFEAIQNAATNVSIAQLEDAINRNDLRALEMLLRLEQGALFPVSEAIRSAFIGGGLSAGTIISRGQFGFDGRHYRAEAWVRENAGTLVQGIETQTLEMLRTVMENRVATGESGAKTARAIVGTYNRATGRREGGFLGLTSQQTDAAIRARAELGNLDANYFTRKLRDKRFDRMVQKAIDAGKPLSAADIDRIIRGYNSKQLRYRGELIARTEARAAISSGQYEGLTQAVERGATITAKWIHGGSREPRFDHLAMDESPPRLLGQPFIMADGTALRYAHDPQAPIRHRAGCKCSMFFRVV